MVKVGIPRAFLYYRYYPMWDAFFQRLGVEVVVSPYTNQEILHLGVMNTIDEACLPLKAYIGHVIKLTEMQMDYIFVPRFISLEKHRYLCPKFLGLPDLIKGTLQQYELPEMLTPTINLRTTKKEFYMEVLQLAKTMNKNPISIYQAVNDAFQTHENYKKLLLAGTSYTEALKMYQQNKKEFVAGSYTRTCESDVVNKKRLHIAVVSHSYILHDSHISMNLLSKLAEFDCEVSTPEMLASDSIDKALENLSKDMFWSLNREIMGSSYHHLEKLDVDGMIIVNAFACGPDAITKELIERTIKRESKIPILSLTIDEHTGEAGFVTRLEAFIDMMKRRNKGGNSDENNLSAHGEFLCRNQSPISSIGR